MTSQVSIIQQLKQQVPDGKEIEYCVEGHRLRIDLRDDDISLWQSHLASHAVDANLLLACESSNAELTETRLTWIVGAAIRSTTVFDCAQATTLLKSLGVSQQLLSLVVEHCVGLGESMVWAFHMDRNFCLTATPVSPTL